MADQKPTCLALKCIVEIWQEEFAFKWLMSVMVFFPLLWIGSTFANSDELVWILIYIVTAKNVEPESIARTIRAVCGFGMCVIVLSALIGIIPNNYELAINEAGKVTIRMYMGFIHCNVFGSFLRMFPSNCMPIRKQSCVHSKAASGFALPVNW